MGHGLNAVGRRAAAWRLLHRLMKDGQRAILVLASLDDDRLVLEFIALGTWAGQPFVVPASLRSSYARMRLRMLFLPGKSIELPQAERVLTATLRDRRPALRKTAASLLGSMGSTTGVPALIEALHDPVSTEQLQTARLVWIDSSL